MVPACAGLFLHMVEVRRLLGAASGDRQRRWRGEARRAASERTRATGPTGMLALIA